MISNNDNAVPIAGNESASRIAEGAINPRAIIGDKPINVRMTTNDHPTTPHQALMLVSLAEKYRVSK